MRATWMLQELLTTFQAELGQASLLPGTGGVFEVRLDGDTIWFREAEGRFPDLKELKQLVRDRIAPDRQLGHSDASCAYGYRVRDALRDLEGRVHAALDHLDLRVPGVDRTNANEWFFCDDRLLAVLFDAGAILARARGTGRPLGTRTGTPGWHINTLPASDTVEGILTRLSRLAGV